MVYNVTSMWNDPQREVLDLEEEVDRQSTHPRVTSEQSWFMTEANRRAWLNPSYLIYD